MLADNFTVNSPLYKAAVILCSQPNKPKTFKIGRMAGAPVHTVTFQCTSAVQGDKYTVDYVANDGTTGTISYTVGASETTTTVATAIELLVEAIPGVASTSSTDTVNAVTSTAGTITTYANWSSNFKFTDVTATRVSQRTSPPSPRRTTTGTASFSRTTARRLSSTSRRRTRRRTRSSSATRPRTGACRTA